jgi:hypothetical protein
MGVGSVFEDAHDFSFRQNTRIIQRKKQRLAD